MRILYRILRGVDLHRLNLSMPGLIGYTELSHQFAQQPGGYWVDPHPQWDEPLAEIDRRCFPLFHGDFRPVLSVLVVHQGGDLRPGEGFRGIVMPDSGEVTPAHRSEEAWVGVWSAVYVHTLPAGLDDLPRI